MFSCFDRIHLCDRQTDRQTDDVLTDDVSYSVVVDDTDDCFRSLVVSRSSTRGSTTVTSSSSGYHLIYSDTFRLSSTPRLICSSVFVATTTSPTLLQLLTACVYLNRLHKFKVAMMAFRVLRGLASPYLDQLLRGFLDIC